MAYFGFSNFYNLAVEDVFVAISGRYEGKFVNKQVGQADLELKIDADQTTEHSHVLNIVSGSISKSKGKFLR